MPNKEIFKCLVGRPKKELQAILLTSKVKPRKPQIKTPKVCCTNWLSFSFWLLIYAVVKQHRNIQSALNYLRVVFRKPGEISIAYNTELAIHALDQVHCWDAYFRLRIGHYENFTPLNFQPLLFSKQ
jgi:hypothetical protein